MSIVTETWLQDRAVENTLIDTAGEHGLDAFLLNTDRNPPLTADSMGGVAIFGRSTSTKFTHFEVPNPENFEVLGVAGKVNKIRKRAVMIAVYIPPNYPRVKAEACFDYVADFIAEAKGKVRLSHDYSGWRLEPVGCK